MPSVLSQARNQNPLARMYLTSTGDGSRVSTLRLQVSANTTVTIEGDANFYTTEADATGGLNASKTWTITAGALRTIYIKMTGASKTAVLKIPNRLLLIRFGTNTTNGWVSVSNAVRLTFTPSQFVNVTQLRITGTSTIIGAFPTGLTTLYLEGNLINWTYEGALPTGLTTLYLEGNLINWTALDASGNGNITTFNLTNHRDLKMTAEELVTLLTSMINRVGNLPATASIGDIANPTSTDAAVLQALADLVTVKGCTVTRSA